MRRWILVAIFLAVLSTLGALIWSRRAPAWSYPSVTLRDGTVIRVEAVTYGTQHEWGGDSRMKVFARRLLPVKYWSKLGPQHSPATRTTEFPTAVIYFSETSATTGRPVTPQLGDLAVVDDHGQIFTVGGSNTSSGSRVPVQSMALETFPRRQRDFEVRVRRNGELISLHVPNPVAGHTFPKWQAEPLPQTRRAGEVELTLKKLRLHAMGQVPGEPGRPYYTERAFGVRYQGQDRSDWFAQEVHLLDATGNRGWSQLPLTEPVWKVHVALRRAGAFPFPPEQVRSLGKVRVPGPGETVELGTAADLRRDGLSFALLLGPGHFVIKAGQVTLAEPLVAGAAGGNSSSSGSSGADWHIEYSSSALRLVLEARGASGLPVVAALGGDYYRALVRIRDAQGRFHTLRPNGRSTSMGNGSGSVLSEFECGELPAPGEAELELVDVGPPWEFDFPVPAPAAPK